MEHHNRIAGQEVPSRRAGRFRWCHARRQGEVLGTFPRSGVEELDAAWDALAGAQAAWWRRDPADRRRAVAGGLGALERSLEAEAGALAAGLGLDAAEHLPELHAAVAAGEAAARAARGAGPGIALVAPDWSLAAPELLAAVVDALVAGQVVLLLADPRQPLVASLLVGALLEGGVPPGALALLHGSETELREEALRRCPRRLHAWGGLELVARLRRAAAGAGVPEQRLLLHRARAAALSASADPEGAAERVVEAAFGRARTLSGQRGGHLGCLHVPERMLSRFTAELLALLEGSRAGREPVPALDRTVRERANRLRTRGLDEGATLLSHPGRGEGPAVLTNAERHMASARRIEPAPVLVLVRDRLDPRAGVGDPASGRRLGARPRSSRSSPAAC